MTGRECTAVQTLGSDAAILARDSPVLVVYADLCRTRHRSAYRTSTGLPLRHSWYGAAAGVRGQAADGTSDHFGGRAKPAR